MRLTLTMLGHTLDITLDAASSDHPEQRDGSADALVERADPHDTPTFGFTPPRHLEDHR